MLQHDRNKAPAADIVLAMSAAGRRSFKPARCARAVTDPSS
jgi:hypothetical protein